MVVLGWCRHGDPPGTASRALQTSIHLPHTVDCPSWPESCRDAVGTWEGLQLPPVPLPPSAKITGKEGSSIGGRNPACTAGARECWRLHLLCTLPPSQANPSTRAPLQHGRSERGRVAGALILHPLVKNFSINVPTATVT